MLTADACEILLAPLLGAHGVLLAVSGGPDSMALLHLAAQWRDAAPARPSVLAATVDHGLRPEARGEAQAVGEAARTLNIPHAVLPWVGEKPRTGVQERARSARYALLAAHARSAGADCIVTAHHMDDQAETVLMRLSRGTGVAGLAGMRARSFVHGLALHRPLLGVRKTDLIAHCEETGAAFSLDASNHDPRYARVRMRHLAPLLEREGLTAERLYELSARAQRADAALEAVARATAQRLGVARFEGGASVPFGDLAGEPEEIVLRVLLQAVEGVAAAPVRLGRFEAAQQRLGAALRSEVTLSFTLAGAYWRLSRDGLLHIRPEPPRKRGRLPHAGPAREMFNCGQAPELVHAND